MSRFAAAPNVSSEATAPASSEGDTGQTGDDEDDPDDRPDVVAAHAAAAEHIGALQGPYDPDGNRDEAEDPYRQSLHVGTVRLLGRRLFIRQSGT